MCEVSPLLRSSDVGELMSRIRELLDRGDLEALTLLQSLTAQVTKPVVAINAAIAIREVYKLALRAPFDGTYYYLPARCCQALAEALAAARAYAYDPVVRVLLSQIRFEPGCRIHRDAVNAMAQLFARIWYATQ